MREWQSQSHVRWYCRYHVVWVPKYRKRAIFGEMRSGSGRIVRELCQRSGVELVEGHALSDHVHVLLGIPLKLSVANTVGFLKGKSDLDVWLVLRLLCRPADQVDNARGDPRRRHFVAGGIRVTVARRILMTRRAGAPRPGLVLSTAAGRRIVVHRLGTKLIGYEVNPRGED